MPHTRSSKKSHRKSLKRKAANKEAMSRMRTELKKFRSLLQEGKLPEGQAEARKAAKLLDKAAKSRIIHPNKAARDKSRLARKLAAAAKK